MNGEYYAELDHILTHRRWHNSIKDVKSDMKANIQTDHFPLLIKIRTKLSRTIKKKKAQTRYLKPVGEEIEKYNQELKKGREEGEQKKRDMEEIIKRAANSTLRKNVREANKDYITEGTWQKLEERGKAREERDWQQADELTKEFRKAAKKDKTAQIK